MLICQRIDTDLFPRSAETGKPHILQKAPVKVFLISLEDEAEHNSHQLCDFITTMLYELKQHPKVVVDFFDPKLQRFQLRRAYAPGKQGKFMSSILVLREGDTVLASIQAIMIGARLLISQCGFYNERENQDDVDWTHIAKSKLSKVSAKGEWKTVWGVKTGFKTGPIQNIRADEIGAADEAGDLANARHQKELQDATLPFEKLISELEA